MTERNSSRPSSCFSSCDVNSVAAPCDVILKTTPDGKIQASRSRLEKEKCPDRICLDRRGLTKLPFLIGEPRLRLLSLQHNLITRLDGFTKQSLTRLVFLDVYDNQLEKIAGLEGLGNLRVLLLGKNRIRRIEGFQALNKLEVLDLHGNQILQVGGLTALCELKVLNLAGNQIRVIGPNDLQGLVSLKELNLRRNRIKRLVSFLETPQLQKLFLSNNEIQVIDNMCSIANATQLRELTLDGNPVSLGGEYVSFIVSHLPQLKTLSHMEVTDAVRKSAAAWRHTKEASTAASMMLNKNLEKVDNRREEVISNARTNWELLRCQTQGVTPSKDPNCTIKELVSDTDFDISSERCVQSDSGISITSSISTNPNGAETMQKSRRRIDISNSAQRKRLNFAQRKNLSRGNVNASQLSLSANPMLNLESFCLPPILTPFINKSEEKSNSDGSSCNLIEEGLENLQRWDSLSSIEPNIDSSLSSLPTDSSSGGETESETSEDLLSIPESTTNEDKPMRTIKSAISYRKRTASKTKTRAATSRPKQKQKFSSSKVREQGGDFLVEITGRCLNIYGQGALRFIDRPWNSSKAIEVSTVRFNYINYNAIIPIFARIKQRFPNVENFNFRETNITCLGQLNALADIQGLTSLNVDPEGNPVTQKNWESYSIYRLSHWGLKFVNEKEITEAQISAACEEFQGLSDIVLWSLPDSLLQPLLNRLHLEGSRSGTQLTAKQWLFSADPALRSVVSKEALQWRRGALSQEDLVWRHKGRVHLSHLLENACAAVQKLRQLENQWPSILLELVQETLVDYSQLESYMKKGLNELKAKR